MKVSAEEHEVKLRLIEGQYAKRWGGDKLDRSDGFTHALSRITNEQGDVKKFKTGYVTMYQGQVSDHRIPKP
eukprot:2136974-Pyramimonas_sp.AAC.1